MDVEKTIEFLLQNQAQSQARFDARMDKLSEAIAQHSTQIAENTRQIAENASHIAQLVGITENLARNQIDLNGSFRALREAQRQTEESLNALIKTVDDVVRRDGGLA